MCKIVHSTCKTLLQDKINLYEFEQEYGTENKRSTIRNIFIIIIIIIISQLLDISITVDIVMTGLYFKLSLDSPIMDSFASSNIS